MDHIHPEFGCFCPTPRFRRDVRLAFFAVIFGGLIGSVTVLALSTSDRNAETSTARVANPRVTQTETPKERLGGVEAPTRAAITRSAGLASITIWIAVAACGRSIAYF